MSGENIFLLKYSDFSIYLFANSSLLFLLTVGYVGCFSRHTWGILHQKVPIIAVYVVSGSSRIRINCRCNLTKLSANFVICLGQPVFGFVIVISLLIYRFTPFLIVRGLVTNFCCRFWCKFIIYTSDVNFDRFLDSSFERETDRVFRYNAEMSRKNKPPAVIVREYYRLYKMSL